MSNWISIAAFSDRVSAEATAELLRNETITVYIDSDEHVPGLGSHFSVTVAPDQARRAQWLLRQSHVSEQELTFLATGESVEEASEGPNSE